MYTTERFTDIVNIDEDGNVTRTLIDGSRDDTHVEDCYLFLYPLEYEHIVAIFGEPTINGTGKDKQIVWVVRTPAGLALVHNARPGVVASDQISGDFAEHRWMMRVTDQPQADYIAEALA